MIKRAGERDRFILSIVTGGADGNSFSLRPRRLGSCREAEVRRFRAFSVYTRLLRVLVFTDRSGVVKTLQQCLVLNVRLPLVIASHATRAEAHTARTGLTD